MAVFYNPFKELQSIILTRLFCKLVAVILGDSNVVKLGNVARCVNADQVLCRTVEGVVQRHLLQAFVVCAHCRLEPVEVFILVLTRPSDRVALFRNQFAKREEFVIRRRQTVVVRIQLAVRTFRFYFRCRLDKAFETSKLIRRIVILEIPIILIKHYPIVCKTDVACIVRNAVVFAVSLVIFSLIIGHLAFNRNARFVRVIAR